VGRSAPRQVPSGGTSCEQPERRGGKDKRGKEKNRAIRRRIAPPQGQPQEDTSERAPEKKNVNGGSRLAEGRESEKEADGVRLGKSLEYERRIGLASRLERVIFGQNF